MTFHVILQPPTTRRHRLRRHTTHTAGQQLHTTAAATAAKLSSQRPARPTGRQPLHPLPPHTGPSKQGGGRGNTTDANPPNGSAHKQAAGAWATAQAGLLPFRKPRVLAPLRETGTCLLALLFLLFFRSLLLLQLWSGPLLPLPLWLSPPPSPAPAPLTLPATGSHPLRHPLWLPPPRGLWDPEAPEPGLPPLSPALIPFPRSIEELVASPWPPVVLQPLPPGPLHTRPLSCWRPAPLSGSARSPLPG